MALANIQKIEIYGLKSEQESLFEALQDFGRMHITDYGKPDQYDDLMHDSLLALMDKDEKQLEGDIARLHAFIETVSQYIGKS